MLRRMVTKVPNSEVYNQAIQFITEQLSQVVRESEKEVYTREELLQLLEQVSDIMRK